MNNNNEKQDDKDYIWWKPQKNFMSQSKNTIFFSKTMATDNKHFLHST